MHGSFRARLGVLFVSVGVLLIGLAVSGPSAQAAVQSLAGWTQQGTSAGATWQVAGNGNSVQVTQSGPPSFFVGPKTMNAGSFTVDITPNGATDDDFVGVVLGYLQPTSDPSCNTANCPNNYILLDWKRVTEPEGANEGFTLMKLHGNFDIRTTGTHLPCFWTHVNDNAAGCSVLATSTGAGKGWTAEADNRLRFTYSLAHIKVEKINVSDGSATTVFDLDAPLQGGAFGFYNYAQDLTTYSISDVVITDPAQATATTTTSTTLAPTTTTTGATPTTLRTTTTAGQTLTTKIARTGNDSRATMLELLGGVALIVIGALFSASRGRRPEGNYFS